MLILLFLLLTCNFSSVYANMVWPSINIALVRGLTSTVIAAKLLMEIKFMKRYTKGLE